MRNTPAREDFLISRDFKAPGNALLQSGDWTTRSRNTLPPGAALKRNPTDGDPGQENMRTGQ